jgi:hypothetical protein
VLAPVGERCTYLSARYSTPLFSLNLYLGKLIDSKRLTASFFDASASGSSEAKGSNADLGDFEETAFISAYFYLC